MFILLISIVYSPHEIDEAARRRLVKKLYVPLPEPSARAQLITNLLKAEKHDITPLQLQDIVEKTEGYSGADLRYLCTEAAFMPIRDITDIKEASRDTVRPIAIKDFDAALKVIRASVAQKDLAALEEWNRLYGSFPMPDQLTNK